jgi:PAS domain S-box-containing protein
MSKSSPKTSASGQAASKNISVIYAFLMFISILFICLIAAGYFSVHFLREDTQRREHKLILNLLSEQIDHIIKERFKVIKALATNSTVRGVVNGTVEPEGPKIKFLLNSALSISYADVIYIIDEYATTLSSSDVEGTSIVGYNYAFRPYYTEAIAGKDTVFPAVGAKTNIRGLHLSTPIYGGDMKKPIGVMALKIKISEVDKLIEQRHEKIALLSPDNIIFSSNQPDWLYRSINKLSKQTIERLKKNRQFGDEKITALNWDISNSEIQLDQKSYYLAKAPLIITGWKILSLQLKDKDTPLPPNYKYLIATALSVLGGMAVLIFFLVANVLHRKKTEVMLRNAEEKYSSIFKNAVMGVYQSNLGGGFIEASPSMATLLGYDDPDDLITSITDIDSEIYVNPQDRNRFLEMLKQHRKLSQYVTRFHTKDGRKIWVMLSGRLAYGLGRSEPYIEGFCMDISEKVAAEEALLREKDIFSRVTETCPVGIILMNARSEITFANPRGEQILSLKKNQDSNHGYARPDWSITELDGSLIQPADQPVSQVLANRSPIRDTRVGIRWADGRTILLSLNLAPLFDESGEVGEIVAVFEDITEIIKEEKLAARRQQQLVQADRMISMGILAAGIAHEINNPNTFIHSNAQLLLNAWKGAETILDEYHGENGDFLIGGLQYSRFREKLPTLCSHILDGSRRIGRIVKELGDYSRNDAIDQLEYISINQAVQSVRILLASMIKKSTNHMHVELAQNLPRIRGRLQRLEQVLVNIVQNACQALTDPGQKVWLSTHFDPSQKQVVVVCRDSGAGIKQEDMKRVFDPFFTTKRDSGGTGLGLSISATIVREMGGAMEIESKPGQGTSITLSFPAQTGSGT